MEEEDSQVENNSQAEVDMAGQDPQCMAAVEDSQAEVDSVVDNLQCTAAVLVDNLAVVLAGEVDFQDNSVVEVASADLVDNNLCMAEDSKAVIIISTNNKIHTDSL